MAINQLPKNQDTLWLRVLGNGETQKRAMQELVEVSTENERNYLLEILASWRKNMQINLNVSDEDRELIMALSPAYLNYDAAFLIRKNGFITAFIANFTGGIISFIS